MFAKVVIFAFVGAVSPILLTESILMLASRNRPLARSVAFALGASAFIVPFGVAMLVVFGAAGGVGDGRLSAILDVVIGAILVGVGLAQLRARPKTEAAHRPSARLAPIFLFGIWAMATNFTTLVVYVGATKEIDRADPEIALLLVAFVLLNVIVLLPVLLPPVAERFAHDVVQRLVDRLRAASSSSKGKWVTALVLGGIGVYFMAEGARHL